MQNGNAFGNVEEDGDKDVLTVINLSSLQPSPSLVAPVLVESLMPSWGVGES